LIKLRFLNPFSQPCFTPQLHGIIAQLAGAHWYCEAEQPAVEPTTS